MSSHSDDPRSGSLWIDGDAAPAEPWVAADEPASAPAGEGRIVSDETVGAYPSGDGTRGKAGKIALTVVMGGALVVAALAVTHHPSASSSTPASANAGAAPGAAPSGGSQSNGTAPNGGFQGGGPSGGGGPQFGNPVDAATLAKLKAAVGAKYPGTIERAMQLPDGAYEVHVIQSTGEVHVRVSQDFEVTGVEQGGPGGGGAGPTQ